MHSRMQYNAYKIRKSAWNDFNQLSLHAFSASRLNLPELQTSITPPWYFAYVIKMCASTRDISSSPKRDHRPGVLYDLRGWYQHNLRKSKLIV